MIYHGLSLGGIETLIVRSANYFSSCGLSVVIFARPGELEAELLPDIEVIHIDKYCEIWGQEFDKIWGREVDKNKEALILAFDPLTFMVAKRLQRRLFFRYGRKSRLHAGIFHPRTLSWPSHSRLVRWLDQVVFKLAQDNEFYFMSDAVKSSSEKIVRTVAARKIIRIPMTYSAATKTRIDINSSKLDIVSVGRLVEFKSYNRYIPSIVAALLNEGVDVTWTVWGDGEDFDRIKKLVEHYNLENRIHLMGVLPYSKFSSVVSNADLFIGMGTAALEAAGMGIPTICCVDQREDACYGFLNQAPLDTIGEHVPGFNYRRIGDEILAFSAMSATERSSIGQYCRSAALDRSGSASFNELLAAPSGPNLSISEKLIYLLSAPFLFAVDSRKSKFLFRALRKTLPWV